MDNQGSRASESPTRTIDSVDSTAMSVETIVDRTATSNVAKTTEKLLQDQSAALANSTNMTNNCNKNSLTNSQISMISNDQKDSHIYSSPDLVTVGKVSKELKEKISMTLEQTLKDKGKRPPVVDKLPVKEDTSVKKRKFPIQILLGIIQILLSVTLAALGGLLIARGASLATTGCGLWAGAIAGIAGVLGVINIQNARTGFLAVSLVCVASSTLAMALVGIGLVRDINRLEQEGDESIKGAISAGSGLVFALVMHFAVSILSVYQSALKLCSRGPSNRQMLENVITVNNASVISQHKVEEYIKNYEQQVKLGSLQHVQKGGKTPTTPENRDKLMALWMNTTGRRGVRSNKSGVPPSPSRTIMLVPAGAGNGLPTMLPPNYCHPAPPPSIIYSPRMMPPGTPAGPQLPYPSLPLPPLPPGSVIHPHDIKTLYRALSPRTASEVSSKRQKQTHRTGKNSASRRQRRKSESDAEFKKAFTYTGLDRAIADSFLERQEATNHSGDTSLTLSATGGKDVAV